MKNPATTVRLLVFPALAVVCFYMALQWARSPLHILRSGTIATGTISAILKIQPEQTNRITRLDQQLNLTLESGGQFTFHWQEGRAPAMDGIHPALQKKLQAAANCDLQTLNNIIVGEAGKPAAQKEEQGRIVRLQRIETAWVDGQQQTTDVTMQIDDHNSVSKQILPEGKTDFIMYEQDFACTFRPVFTFTVGTQTVTQAASIGRKQNPPDGYELHRTVPVAYLPDDPQQAMLLPDFDRIRALIAEKPVIGINEYIVVILSRWFYPIVLAGCGIVFSLIGITLISLAVKPPHTETADAD